MLVYVHILINHLNILHRIYKCINVYLYMAKKIGAKLQFNPLL